MMIQQPGSLTSYLQSPAVHRKYVFNCASCPTASLTHENSRRAMRTAFSGVSLAPSPAVLRFLKIQTETLCFLHTSKRPVQPRIPRRSFRARLDSQQFSSTSRISVSRQGQIRLCASPTNDSSTNAANPSSRPRIAQGRCLQKESVRRASSWSAKGKDKPWETWRARRAADAKGLGPNHLPSPLSLEDTGSIGRAIKPGSELMLRCTEFDGSGNVTLINGEFKKTELIQKVCPGPVITSV